MQDMCNIACMNTYLSLLKLQEIQQTRAKSYREVPLSALNPHCDEKDAVKDKAKTEHC